MTPECTFSLSLESFIIIQLHALTKSYIFTKKEVYNNPKACASEDPRCHFSRLYSQKMRLFQAQVTESASLCPEQF